MEVQRHNTFHSKLALEFSFSTLSVYGGGDGGAMAAPPPIRRRLVHLALSARFRDLHMKSIPKKTMGFKNF